MGILGIHLQSWEEARIKRVFESVAGIITLSVGNQRHLVTAEDFFAAAKNPTSICNLCGTLVALRRLHTLADQNFGDQRIKNAHRRAIYPLQGFPRDNYPKDRHPWNNKPDSARCRQCLLTKYLGRWVAAMSGEEI